MRAGAPPAISAHLELRPQRPFSRHTASPRPSQLLCIANQVYSRQRSAATAIAAAAHALPCRRELAASRLAATALQAAARRKACASRYKIQRAAALAIAALARGRAARRLVATYRRALRLMHMAVRRWLRHREWAAAVLQKAAEPWLRELMRVRAAKQKILNTRAIDDMLTTISLTPRPPQYKKTATRRGNTRWQATAARSPVGDAALVASGLPPRVPAGATVKALLSKAPGPRRWAGEGLGFDQDALQHVAVLPRGHVPAYQKGTLTMTAVPPSDSPPGVSTVEAWRTPPRQKSMPANHGDNLIVLTSPRSHIRTADLSNGWDTYVARRSGPLDGLQLPPLLKPVVRPRRACENSYF